MRPNLLLLTLTTLFTLVTPTFAEDRKPYETPFELLVPLQAVKKRNPFQELQEICQVDPIPPSVDPNITYQWKVLPGFYDCTNPSELLRYKEEVLFYDDGFHLLMFR